jgi:hypothetical protein
MEKSAITAIRTQSARDAWFGEAHEEGDPKQGVIAKSFLAEFEEYRLQVKIEAETAAILQAQETQIGSRYGADVALFALRIEDSAKVRKADVKSFRRECVSFHEKIGRDAVCISLRMSAWQWQTIRSAAATVKVSEASIIRAGLDRRSRELQEFHASRKGGKGA